MQLVGYVMYVLEEMLVIVRLLWVLNIPAASTSEHYEGNVTFGILLLTVYELFFLFTKMFSLSLSFPLYFHSFIYLHHHLTLFCPEPTFFCNIYFTLKFFEDSLFVMTVSFLFQGLLKWVTSYLSLKVSQLKF